MLSTSGGYAEGIFIKKIAVSIDDFQRNIFNCIPWFFHDRFWKINRSENVFISFLLVMDTIDLSLFGLGDKNFEKNEVDNISVRAIIPCLCAFA